MGRILAPVLSALVVAILAAAYAVFFFLVLDEVEVEVAGVIRYVIAAGALVVVVGLAIALIQRIKEIRGGQEDALSKY